MLVSSDTMTGDPICSRIFQLCEEGLFQQVKRMGVTFDDQSPSFLRLRRTIELAAQRVQRCYMLVLEADVLPEVRRCKAFGNHQNQMTGPSMTSTPLSRTPVSNVSGMTYSHPLMMTQDISDHSGPNAKVSYIYDMNDISPCESYVIGHHNSNPAVIKLGSDDGGSSMGSLGGMDIRNFGSSVGMMAHGGNMGLMPAQQQQGTQLAELLDVQCMLDNQAGVHGMNSFNQLLLQQQQQRTAQLLASQSAAALSSAYAPYDTNAANSHMAMMQQASLQPQVVDTQAMGGGLALPMDATPKFLSLPISVQMKILRLTHAYTVIRLQDFDEKVVKKLLFLVDRYSEQECLLVIDNLATRMRTKHSAMKNGAAYLDVAISSHLSVLLARATCPGVSSLMEYSASRLPEPVHGALCDAIASNHWLSWDKLDLAVINLLSKLPEDYVLTKLKDIGTRSFRNVDNISACITTLLSAKSNGR